jgi:hypothetical protein
MKYCGNRSCRILTRTTRAGFNGTANRVLRHEIGAYGIPLPTRCINETLSSPFPKDEMIVILCATKAAIDV